MVNRAEKLRVVCAIETTGRTVQTVYYCRILVKSHREYCAKRKAKYLNAIMVMIINACNRSSQVILYWPDRRRAGESMPKRPYATHPCVWQCAHCACVQFTQWIFGAHSSRTVMNIISIGRAAFCFSWQLNATGQSSFAEREGENNTHTMLMRWYMCNTHTHTQNQWIAALWFGGEENTQQWPKQWTPGHDKCPHKL